MKGMLGLLLLGGCDDAPPVATGMGELLGIGDSYQDIHEDADIVEVAARTLGRTVENVSVGGETMFGDHDTSIPNQYRAGEYGWVVATGGGNDLGTCQCGVDCTPVVDGLISTDGATGAIPALIDRIVGDGTGVVWVGYMRPAPMRRRSPIVWGRWTCCGSGWRWSTGDSARWCSWDGVDIGTGAEAELYAEDGYHTSEEGSAQLGALVASAIQEAEAAR